METATDFTDEYIDWVKSLITKGRLIVEESGCNWSLMPPWALIKMAQDEELRNGDDQ